MKCPPQTVKLHIEGAKRRSLHSLNGSTGGKIQKGFAFNLKQDRNVGRKGESIIAVVAPSLDHCITQKKMYFSRIYMKSDKKS